MINVAVVGCGNWGQNYVRNFSELEGAKLALCCDASESRLNNIRQKYQSVSVTRSFNDVLNNPDIDAVVIATPAETHFALARACLLKGKHILVEKPFTTNSHDARLLLNLAGKMGVAAMVGHILDYHPALNMLKDYIKSGELGQIYYLYANRTNLGLVREDVSVMWDLAPHDIATFLYLLDETPTHVSMKGQAFINEGLDDVVFLTLKFASGIMANIHVSWLDPCKVRKTTIIGEKKMIVFDDAEVAEKVRIYNKGVNRKENFESFADFQYTFSNGDVYIPNIKMSEPLRTQCKHFLDCIREGKTPLTDAKNGLDVVQILEVAEQSQKANGEFLPVGSDYRNYRMAAGNGRHGFMAKAKSFWRDLRVVKG